MGPEAILRLFEEFTGIGNILLERVEIDMYVSLHDNYRKILVVAIASYFEARVCQALLDYALDVSDQDAQLVEFIRNKAIARQYHTYFDWNERGRGANRFFSLFGAKYKDRMKNAIDADDELRNSIESFIEIGLDRNRLMHTNYADYTLEKTIPDIHHHFQQALKFIELIPDTLRIE